MLYCQRADCKPTSEQQQSPAVDRCQYRIGLCFFCGYGCTVWMMKDRLNIISVSTACTDPRKYFVFKT